MSITRTITANLSGTVVFTIVEDTGSGPVALDLSTNNGWTESPTGTWTGTIGSRAVSSEALTGDGWVQCTVSSSNNQITMSLGPSNALVDYATLPFAMFISTGPNSFGYIPFGGSPVDTGPVVAAGDLIRLRRAGSTLYAEYNTGAGWTTAHTFAATSSDPLYFHLECFNGNTIVNPVGLGFA